MYLAGSLRAHRTRLGLTPGRLADLLGASQANLSAYETGRLIPGRIVASRIAAFTHLPEDTVYRRRWPTTLASTALHLPEELRTGASETDMLHVIIQASDDFPNLTSPVECRLFLAEPGTTGDRGYDALLASLAVHLCREAGVESTPARTRAPSRYLEAIWWFGRSRAVPGIRALTLRDAIPSMRARGVMFSRRNLESV
jgi:transcriptional regulator with XRE-family HTH domain